jgi:hypothetical protein
MEFIAIPAAVFGRMFSDSLAGIAPARRRPREVIGSSG